MFTITDGEKFVVVIVIGYGVTQGAAHQSKAASAVRYALAPCQKVLLPSGALNRHLVHDLLDRKSHV